MPPGWQRSPCGRRGGPLHPLGAGRACLFFAGTGWACMPVFCGDWLGMHACFLRGLAGHACTAEYQFSIPPCPLCMSDAKFAAWGPSALLHRLLWQAPCELWFPAHRSRSWSGAVPDTPSSFSTGNECSYAVAGRSCAAAPCWAARTATRQLATAELSQRQLGQHKLHYHLVLHHLALQGEAISGKPSTPMSSCLCG
jgi:hypothetical protein